MRRISHADPKNDSEFSTNTASRPSVTMANPPTAAPIAKLMDQVVDDSALADGISSGEVMFGITAERPGSNNPQQTVSQNSSANSSHSVPRERTSSMESTITARATSAKIITC